MSCGKCGSANVEPLKGKTYCNSCGALTEVFKSYGQLIAYELTGHKPEVKEGQS